MFRRYRLWLLIGLAVCACSSFAADDFPSKPITIIVPYPAGSTADLSTREIVPFVSSRLKQKVIVENRTGAGGNIGTEMAARAAPDGHTVLYVTASTIALNPHLYKGSKFDPLTDLILLVVNVRGAAILVVNSQSPYKSLSDLIAAAKAKPGGLTLTHSGPGSIQHLMGERLKRMADIDLLAVAYKGDTAALTDLIGGRVDAALTFAFVTLPHIRSGRVRPLAVTGANRLSVLPDVPTVAEAGVAGYDERVWTGFAVPTATPRLVTEKLYAAFYSAAMEPEYRRLVEQRGSESLVMNREESTVLLKADFERFRGVVRELGLRVE